MDSNVMVSDIALFKFTMKYCEYIKKYNINEKN